MTGPVSLESLCTRLNEWCAEHGVAPVNGQAGERMTERSVRYYRTLGLMDPPQGGGYGEKHLLQLIAARLLQAQGQPLRRIGELLYGRSLDELRAIRDRGLVEGTQFAAPNRISPAVTDENWRVIPLDDDFLIISRRGTPLTPAQRDALRAVLHVHVPSSPHSLTK